MARRRTRFDRQHGNALFITELVHMMGVIALVVAPLSVIAMLAIRALGTAPVNAMFVALLLAGGLAGVAIGALLLGLAAMLRYGYTLARAQDRADMGLEATDGVSLLGGSQSVPVNAAGVPESQASANDDPHGHEVIALLREIRDLVVLPVSEREAVGDRVRTLHKRQAADQVIDAVNRRQLARARALLDGAQAVYGSTPMFDRLLEKLDAADMRNEPLDYTRAKQAVEEAAADGNWAMAEQFAHAVSVEHPESARCRKLWDDTRRARLHTRVQVCANQHKWEEALVAAEEYIDRFGDHPESRSLRQQLPTLRDNVEISTRKRYEQRFRELLANQQYNEALRVARLVTERFPDSPQAQALRERMPALEKRVSPPDETVTAK